MYGQNVDDLVKYQMDTFGYSEDVAREEVVANSAATVLTDEEFVRNLYNNEHSLFEKIRKFFEELATPSSSSPRARAGVRTLRSRRRTCAPSQRCSTGWRRIRHTQNGKML